jgi:hypothetical protein
MFSAFLIKCQRVEPKMQLFFTFIYPETGLLPDFGRTYPMRAGISAPSTGC